MFTLKLNHHLGKFSTTADIGIGNRAEQFNYTSKNTSLLIKQLFVDYAATDNLTVTAGSWTTHVGYELLDAPDNDIYSMSFFFRMDFFSIQGLKQII